MTDFQPLMDMAKRVGYLEGRTELRAKILKSVKDFGEENPQTSVRGMTVDEAKDMIIAIMNALLDSIDEENANV